MCLCNPMSKCLLAKKDCLEAKQKEAKENNHFLQLPNPKVGYNTNCLLFLLHNKISGLYSVY